MRRLLTAAVAISILAFALPGAAQKQDRGYWQAASNNAASITGDISISDAKISINLKGFPLASIRDLKPEEVSAVFDCRREFRNRWHALPSEDTGRAALRPQKHTLRNAGYAVGGSLCVRQDSQCCVLLRRRGSGVHFRRHCPLAKSLWDISVRSLRSFARIGNDLCPFNSSRLHAISGPDLLTVCC